MLVGRVIANIVQKKFREIRRARAFQNALVKDAGEHFGEEGKDVESHWNHSRVIVSQTLTGRKGVAVIIFRRFSRLFARTASECYNAPWNSAEDIE